MLEIRVSSLLLRHLADAFVQSIFYVIEHFWVGTCTTWPAPLRSCRISIFEVTSVS